MSLAKIEVTAGDGHVETRDLPLLDLGAYLKGDESEKAAQAKELQFASETVSFLALKPWYSSIVARPSHCRERTIFCTAA